MPRLKNGMIAIIDGYISNKSKKWLDIEITNSFPLITLSEHSFLVMPGKVSEDISDYDHLSIPSDLRLHISGKDRRIFFDATPVWNFYKNEEPKIFHYFAYVGLPIAKTPYLSGGKTRKWYQAAIISPFKDEKFNPSSTRVFIDFFLHKNPNLISEIIHEEFCMPNMRLAFDRSGCTFGPYLFGDLQRRDSSDTSLFFTLRIGYAELEINNAIYVYVPMSIHKRI